MVVFYQWIKMILGATYMGCIKTENNTTTANSTEKYRQPEVSYRINKLFRC
jgi:hypothetical protein